MRKKLCVFLFTVCLLLTGCTSIQPSYLSQEQISPEFRCKATIVTSSGEWEAIVSHTAENGFSCESDTISYYWSGGQFYETCAGLESEKGPCTLPENSYALALEEYLSLIYEGQLEPIDSETLKGSCSRGDFIIKADGKTGKLKELRCDAAGFLATFQEEF